METKLDLLLTVCDLYYNEKLTQAKISKILNTSRSTISRLLDEARERGIVQINILAPLETNNLMSSKIKNKYGLKDVIIIKNIKNYSYDLLNLGKTIANYVDSIIQPYDILGISWGKAVESFVVNAPNFEWKMVKIIQINGSLGSGADSMDGSELVIRLGEKTGSKYELLTAPSFVNSQPLQIELLNQPQIKRVISMSKEFNISVSGIGNLETRYNTLYSSGIIDNNDLKVLKSKGVVGHLAGRMYDAYGNEVRIDSKWPISPPIEIFKKVPISIGCAIGNTRGKAVIGAIKGELINVLICDEALGESLLY